MEHYVTLFDGGFLPQGLALYRSLVRLDEPFRLWVLCVDEAAYHALVSLNFKEIKPLSLKALETPALLAVKEGRNRAEYCWTLTPFAPRFVFQSDPRVQRVTYLDADLWFLRSPKPIFSEFEGAEKSVLITEHAYHPPYDLTETSGRFCVQFMTFVKGASEPVRQRWEDQCLEWCFDRIQDGRFGDQKYVDAWPTEFSGLVHVLEHPAWTRAPWNVLRFQDKSPIFYHFHGLRLSRWGILRGSYPIPRSAMDAFYKTYFEDIAWALKKMASIKLPCPIQAPAHRFARQALARIKRIILQPSDFMRLFS